MKFFRRIFWLIWIWIIVFLVVTFVNYRIYELVLFFVLFVLVGIDMYLHETHKKSLLKVKNMIKNIGSKPVEEEIKKIKKEQTEYYEKISSLKTELGGYKLEQERKYRDVVRKVLDLDNKLNEKFKLLGESIIRISKRKKNNQ